MIVEVRETVFNEESNSEENEWFCLSCGEEYRKSDREDWIGV